MKRRPAILAVVAVVAVAAFGLTLAGCTTDPVATGETSVAAAPSEAAPAASTEASVAASAEPAAVDWFDQGKYDAQNEQLTGTFEGDPATPYLQYYTGAEMVDTSQYKADGPKKLCFANASISNPWRVTGWITMNQQLQVLKDEGIVSEMETRDAKDSDDQQIADIDYFIGEGNCDVFVISPNSTAAMTPAVERACATGKPVVVFDRGVQTDCMTTFVHPVGGFGFGIASANFLSDNLKSGDRVVALRILPGVDVLEQRWAAAQKIFDAKGITAVDYFTGADPAKIKQIITDELAKGDVQGIWMDAGDGGTAAIEAFEDAGKDLPVMSGEDQIAFLKKWKDSGIKAIGPSYPSMQWRTALLAASDILQGKELPKEWILPQPSVTADNLGDYLSKNKGMPDGHYALFGGENLPGYPQVWIDRQTP
jgi:ribose transport system substrate-binding protein